MEVSKSALASFEYDRILELLVPLCSCPATQERARALLPLAPETLPLHLEVMRELRDLIRFDGDIPFGEFPDLRPVLEVLHLPGVRLSLEEAQKVYRFLLMSQGIRHFLKERGVEKKYPRISSLYFRNIQDFSGFLRYAERILSQDGQVLDTASEKLWNIRRRKEEVQSRIVEVLHRILQDSRITRYLQEPLYTLRKGRYVLPVKAQFRNMLRGFVVDCSSSGSTLFIEPWAVAELANELEVLETLEEEEVSRILFAFTEKLRPLFSALRETFESLVELDLLRAKVKLGERWKGEIPEVGGETLRIYEGRHPLLFERAVPFDLEVSADRSIVVVSGPNGGGKTVLIKALALLVTLTFSGIPAPLAQGSSIPLYDYLFVDIGDHQDLESSLSTFTSRMVLLRAALQKAGPRSLFLIDELGAGTDPHEGAALGIALLEYLKKRGTTCIATTHLPALREYALRGEGVLPASLAFDPDTLRPTYCLVVGSVEGSYGITIAERVGLPQEVIQGARQVLRKEEVAFNELLLSLSREREEMRKKLGELHERLAELGKREEEVQVLRKALEEERRRLTRTLKEEWEARLREREKEIARLVGELRKSRELDEEKYGELREILREERQWLESLKEEREEPQEFQAGDRVFVDPLGRGVVLEVDTKKGEVLVAVGERRVRVAPERLRREEKEIPQESPQTSITTFTLRERITNEVTIRALKAEEALAVLERYLDRAILAGFTTVYIIHGKGEGKLRRVTHEFLRSHPYVQEFRPGRPEEGGLGVTVVTLRT